MSDPHPEAQFCVAAMYYEGIGVKKDIFKAVEWVQKSAAQGYPRAQTNLGIAYLNGDGIELNQHKAYQWILKAAQQGYDRAEYYLGGLYYEGKGVDRNIIEAIKWFKKATEQNFEEAQEALEKVAPVINWKVENRDFKAKMMLLDESGKTYPNEIHITSPVAKSNYLVAKKDEKFIMAISVKGCSEDNEGRCVETAHIGVFKPDWSLCCEFKDVKIESGIGITLKMEPNDPTGQYHIFSIIYENNKPKAELNQFFWVEN